MFVLKARYQTDISEIENKISGTSVLVKKKTDSNAKITEIECQLTSISDLSTNAALNTVENKIPNIRSVFENECKFYPQAYLDESLYESRIKS